ncbi:MAG: MFS transporter [Ilumatobacteraceae bacterium]
MGDNLARLVGSPLGGILVAVGGLPLVVVVDGLSFLAVAVAIVGVRSDARPLSRDAASAAPTEGTRAALGVLRRTRPLPALFTTMGIAQFTQGLFVVLFLAFVIERLGGDGSAVGIIRGAQAVGGLAGGLLLARHVARLSPAALIGIGFGGMAAWGFLFWNLPAVTTTIAVYVVLMALAGPFAMACGVGMTTAVQRFSPPAYLGLSVGSMDAAGALG